MEYNTRSLTILLALVGLSCTLEGHCHPVQTNCDGTFSDGTKLDPNNPVFLQDVPGNQSFCDFHTFAWNQFIWMTQTGSSGKARFLELAPTYNLFVKSGTPTAFPGGSTDLKGRLLEKKQAGDDDELVDVEGRTVLYDIRINETMYKAILDGNLYNKEGYDEACAPVDSKCTKEIWLPPLSAEAQTGSLEMKTAWRQFPSPDECPEDKMFCEGKFGLVGMHLVQKTPTHGEWVWASFEHRSNAPDCSPGQSNPITETGPDGHPWSFFSPASVPQEVMTSKTCSVARGEAQCNLNPAVGSGTDKTFEAVNVCRTDALPAGGASSANCRVPPGKLDQQTANNAGNVSCLNATLRPKLEAVWQNYELIGTLWVEGKVGPKEEFRVEGFQEPQEGITNGKPVGFPHLANTTMETYLQMGSLGYDPLEENETQAGCFFCHNLPSETFEMDLSHTASLIDRGTPPELTPAR